MNKETYEALKRNIEVLNRYVSEDKMKEKDFGWTEKLQKNIKLVEGWISEVSKEYN